MPHATGLCDGPRDRCGIGSSQRPASGPARPLLTTRASHLHSASPEETEAAGARLAAVLSRGDVVAVSGELGAGKTVFVRGAARALGVTGPVTSPTYTIGNSYDGLSHLDLYRFDGLTEADWGALEPYFEDAICFVEWPERAGAWLPEPRLRVTIRHESAVRRLIEFESSEAGLLDCLFRDADPRL